MDYRKLATEIIHLLNDKAIDVCNYDYGLPIHGEHLDNLIDSTELLLIKTLVIDKEDPKVENSDK